MLREWQQDSFEKIQKCNRDESHNVIPVNACVGSGKTMLAALAFGDFIELNAAKKTIQMFITPRIKLCKQQLIEIEGKIKEAYPEEEFQLIPVDCTQDKYNKKISALSAQHVIFIVCDASLWGEDKNEPETRWNGWKSNFDAWLKQGYVFGNVAFDEAHNYKNADKVEKMLGQRQMIFKKNEPIAWQKSRAIIHWFKNVMLLSGTPAFYQKDATKAFPKNSCECPLNLAIKEGWICFPILNLVKHDLESAEKIYANAVIQVMKHEQRRKPANGVRMLVNFNSIDEIAYFTRDEFIKSAVGKKFHLYTIHSDKTFDSKTSLVGQTAKSSIDGVETTASAVYDELEKIDDKQFDLPVIVCQVAMIGEGININSFNSVITKSNSDVTAMQQIGRVLRRFKGKENPNVYCLYDNVDSLKSLLADLMIEHSLTSDCFSWGDKLDVSTGSSQTDENNKETSEMATPKWEKIREDFDADIMTIEYSPEFQSKAYSKSVSSFISSDDFDELMKCFKDFPSDLLQKSIYKMKSNDTISADFKRAQSKAKNEAKALTGEANEKNETKKNVDLPAEDDSANNDAEKQPTIKSSASGKKEAKEGATAKTSSEAIIDIVIAIRSFILKHSNREDVIDNARKSLSALTDYIFSYNPRIADAIKKCRIPDNKAFRKAVGIDM